MFFELDICQKNNGKFILRYDDTDQERSKDEFILSIASDLEWLNIDHDETYFQSKRVDRYNQIFDQLISKKLVYPCFESNDCLLYTSPSPRDGLLSRMPSSA